MTAPQTPATAAELRGAGLRVTAARVALLEVVRDGDHLGVEAIAAGVRERIGHISLQAVYDALHAAISCKWTIRSDRVQNIRHECLQMIRHRRGRVPHLVTVTAEPLPTRLASIARGTGEVDAVYHIAYDALDASVARNANADQQDAWREVVGQRRLLSYELLADTLASW